MAFSCSSGVRFQRNVPAEIRIGANMLFKSWAMPVASVPMPSMRCARKNCASSFFLSVISLASASFASRPAKVMTRELISTVIMVPSFLRCRLT